MAYFQQQQQQQQKFNNKENLYKTLINKLQ